MKKTLSTWSVLSLIVIGSALLTGCDKPEVDLSKSPKAKGAAGPRVPGAPGGAPGAAPGAPAPGAPAPGTPAPGGDTKPATPDATK